MWGSGPPVMRSSGRSNFLTAVLAALFVCSTPALGAAIPAGELEQRDGNWLSPEYKNIFQVRLPIPVAATPMTSWKNETTGIWIDYYELHIRKFQQQVYPNLGPANLIGYNGTAPGPTFHMTKGRESVVRFVNDYDRPSSIHLHGSYSRSPFDGWAEDTTNPGQYKDYYYPNSQKARTLWYHDHASGITALNAYSGQAGMYILTDPDEEERLGLPDKEYEIPIVLQAKQYKANGDLFTPEAERVSLYGDVIHVNGQPWPFLQVEPRKYRFRCLDASISRSFLLSFVPDKTGKAVPFQVIASDAGYLDFPVTVNEMYIGMAERYEIIFDFAPYKNQNITLKNGKAVLTNPDFAATDKVMQFRVGNTVTRTDRNNGPPSSLTTNEQPPPKTNVNKSFKFERKNGQWLINGVGFEDMKNRILEKPARGDVEVWELINDSGGWAHPIHIHLIDFRVVSRQGGRNQVFPYESAGLKDVVILGPNEKILVRAKYAPWDGVYMFHCHNLVHEDHDMMGAFNVTGIDVAGLEGETHFIDPMEGRWRSKPYTGTNLAEIRTNVLPEFSSQDAYADVKKVTALLNEHYGFK